MLFTTYENEDPMKELIVNRFLNNCLICDMADLYDMITGDDLFRVCLDRPRANELLKSILPVSCPKKIALKEYNRVLHLLLSETTMSADLLNAYIIRIILNTEETVVVSACQFGIEKLERFLDGIKEELGLPEETFESYKQQIPEILKEVDGKELLTLLELGHEDNHTIDAMTKQELQKHQAYFGRTFTLLEDYLEGIRLYHTVTVAVADGEGKEEGEEGK